MVNLRAIEGSILPGIEGCAEFSMAIKGMQILRTITVTLEN